MEFTEEYLTKLGFTDFIHLKMADRDGQKRMSWMGVINNEIVAVRVALIDNRWLIDYISPMSYSTKFNTLEDVVDFINFSIK